MLRSVVEPRLINRELANLDFQERVFALAESPERPLLERIKFVAIVSSNLDEFFQVRVAGLLGQADSGITASAPDGMSPKEQLEAIRLRAIDLNARIDDVFNNELLPALDAADIQGEPQATIHLPHHIPAGFHGAWIPS